MKIQTILSRCSKYILVIALVLVLYYYRFSEQLLALRGNDHWNILFQGIILLFFFIGVTSNSIRKLTTPLTKVVVGMLIYISLSSIIYWSDYSGFLNAIIWCIYYLVTYMFFRYEEDEIVLRFSFVSICIITLITGYKTLNIGYIVGVSNGMDEVISFENISNIIITTIPMIMTLRTKSVKWILILAVLIVCFVSARRMAVISSILAVVFSLPELLNNKGKHNIIRIILFLGFVIGSYYLLSGIFQESVLYSSERMGTASEDGGSGRVDIWRKVMVLLGENNILELIFGNGPLGISRLSSSTAAHNEFLEYLFDYGIIGLVMLIIMHVALVKRLKSLFNSKSDYRYSYLMSWVMFLIYQMFGNVLIYTQYCLPLVVYWGFVEAKVVGNNQKRVVAVN